MSSKDLIVNSDNTHKLLEQIQAAYSAKQALLISGGGSKAFYGNQVAGEILSSRGHSGIIEYQPSELVVTVRSGTLLSELEAELNANKQMLAFEPPQHSASTTIGGVIACGLSGPRRAASGAARDFILGTTIINGKAEKLKFGGQVMKNVAGYDAARLMVGAQGTLGLLLDISIKVLPMPGSEISLRLNIALATAIKQIRQWLKQGLPITASCYLNDTLSIRLGSTHSAVKHSINMVNRDYETEEVTNDFWLQIKNQKHDFFKKSPTLWRCSQQTTTPIFENPEQQLLEWNGALRWIHSDENLHEIAALHQGHAQRYRLAVHGPAEQSINNIFQPLSPALLKIHQRLKQAFDPYNILNPGRLYAKL